MGFEVVLDHRISEPLRYPYFMEDNLRDRVHDMEDNLYVRVRGMEVSLCDIVRPCPYVKFVQFCFIYLG